MRNPVNSIILIFCLFIVKISFAQTNDLYLVTENNRIGYINKNGVEIIKPVYKNGGEFSEGLAAVRSNGYYGFIDKTGVCVLPAKYDYASRFQNGIALVWIKGMPVFIDKAGNSVLGDAYKSLVFISKDRAIVQTKTGKYGALDLRSKRLFIDAVYNSLTFEAGIFKAYKPSKKGRKYLVGMFDTIGNEIIPFGKYKEIKKFSDGYAIVTIAGKTEGGIDSSGAIDIAGKMLFMKLYVNNAFIMGDFNNGLAVISLYKYWRAEENGAGWTSTKSYGGYINLKGEIVLNDTNIKHVRDFACGRAFIAAGYYKDYYLINTQMKQVGTDTFERVNDFKNGYAIVEKNGKWGIIDTNGKLVVPPQYDEINEDGVTDSIFFFSQKEGYGIANLNNEVIIKPFLESFDKNGFINGVIRASAEDKLTYINTIGTIIWQEKSAQTTSLSDLNIDYMGRGHFYAYSSPGVISEGLGGHGKNKNYPQEIRGDKFPAGKLSVIIDLNKPDTFAGGYNGYCVYVANTTGDTIKFNAQDGRLYMKLQAQDENGQWKDIDYLPSSWCGNSYHVLKLQPQAFWTFGIPKYEGDISTKMRIELEYIQNKKKGKFIYSNIIDGHINPAQFWNKREYYPSGLMDPYND